VEQSVPLVGSTIVAASGATNAPDLTSATANGSTNTMAYVFDRDLAGGSAPDASDFWYYTTAGTTGSGSGFGTFTASTCSISSSHPNTVNCGGFSNGTINGNTSNAVKAAVDDDQGDTSSADAVVDESGSGANVGTVPVNGGSGNTVSPDLTGVLHVGSSKSYNYTFDQNVGSPCATCFYIESDQGAVYASVSSTISGSDSHTVVATFPDDVNRGDMAARMTRAFVYDGNNYSAPVVDASNSSIVATQGEININTPPNFGSGFTSGADPLSATFDTAGSNVTYNYDEQVWPASVDCDQMFLVNQAAQQYQFGDAGSVDVTNDSTGGHVTCHFAGNTVGLAVGAGQYGYNIEGDCPAGDMENIDDSYDHYPGYAGLFDCSPEGNPSVNVTLGGGPAATAGSSTATATATSTASPTATSTATPPPGPSATSLNLIRKVKPHRVIFKGHLTAANPAVCSVAGQKIWVFRGSKKLGFVNTGAAGGYHFKRLRVHKKRRWHTAFNGTSSCIASSSNSVKAPAR